MDVQIKIEKINTTKYMPTQNNNGWSEPMMSCFLELDIGSGFWFQKDIGASLTKTQFENK
jgi:hypothetical protein